MGKAAGVSRRRKKIAKKKYPRSKQLKRTRLRELKKTGGIKDDVVRGAWDKKISMRKNMANMGLAHDPNKVMAKEERDKASLNGQQTIQSTTARLHQQLLRQKQKQELRKARKAAGDGSNDAETTIEKPKEKTVADKLAEQVAATPAAKNFRFGPDNVKFCAYMLEKYGEDYQAMVRDKRNYYQESAGQIRAKIKRFLTIPEHQRVFLKAKELVDVEMEEDSS